MQNPSRIFAASSEAARLFSGPIGNASCRSHPKRSFPPWRLGGGEEYADLDEKAEPPDYCEDLWCRKRVLRRMDDGRDSADPPHQDKPGGDCPELEQVPDRYVAGL